MDEYFKKRILKVFYIRLLEMNKKNQKSPAFLHGHMEEARKQIDWVVAQFYEVKQHGL